MLIACMCNIYWKLKIRIATVIFFAYLRNVFELLDQGLSTCCSSVLYSDIKLCFNSSQCCDSLVLWIKSYCHFLKKPINSSKTDSTLPLFVWITQHQFSRDGTRKSVLSKREIRGETMLGMCRCKGWIRRLRM